MYRVIKNVACGAILGVFFVALQADAQVLYTTTTDYFPQGSGGSVSSTLWYPLVTNYAQSVSYTYTYGCTQSNPYGVTFRLREADGTLISSSTQFQPSTVSVTPPVLLSAGTPYFFEWYNGATLHANSHCVDNTTLYFSPISGIEITYPANGATVPDNFDFFTLLYSSDQTQPYIEVSYATSSAALWSTSSVVDAVAEGLPIGGGADQTTYISKSGFLCFSQNTCPATWYAQARIWNSDRSTVQATSTQVSFSAYFVAPEIEECTHPICKALHYLFFPSPTSLNRWSGLWDVIKEKPPLGYLTGALSALSGFSTSTAPYALPPELSDLSTFFAPLYTGATAIIWLAVLIWLIRRIGGLIL